MELFKDQPSRGAMEQAQRYIDYSVTEPPKMSAARQKGIAKLIDRGEARSASHAIFKKQAGLIALPD